MRAYNKPVCNKQRDVLLNISSMCLKYANEYFDYFKRNYFVKIFYQIICLCLAFPITPHPGLQPELNVDVLRVTAPTPDTCVVDETVEECRKEMEREKRYYKATKYLREAEEL